MKTCDITEAISSMIEKKIFGEWKHEGYVDELTSNEAYAEIDGKKYRITVQEVSDER